jgi:hypothetical protein
MGSKMANKGLTEVELANIRLRNETVRFAKHLGVENDGIDMIAEIHDLNHRLCVNNFTMMQQLAERYGQFESLYPGAMAKIQTHRISITYGKGKPSRHRLDNITRAARLRKNGKDWNEIVERIHGEKECRAMGPRGRKNLIRLYQIDAASRKNRDKQKKTAK